MNTADGDRHLADSVTLIDAVTLADSVSLADLVETAFPVAWFEAVAIVQEVCAVLLASGPGAETRVPAIDGIEIASTGTTVLARATSSGDGVSRLGQTLVALLTDVNRPVQLRVLVGEATESTPRYASIEEFSTALQYFERAGRTALVRAVYERWIMLPADRRRPKHRQTEPAQPTETVKPPPPANRLWLTRRNALVAAVAAGAVALLGAVALVLPRGGADVPSRGSSLTVASETNPAVTETAGPAPLSLLETPAPNDTPKGDRDLAPPPPAAPEPSPAAPEPRRASRPAAAKPTLRPRLVPSVDPSVGPSVGKEYLFSAPGPSRASGESRPAAPAPFHSAPSSPVWDGTLEMMTVYANPEEAPSSTVYSKSDADVQPPIAIRPQLPTEIPPGIPAEDIAMIEVWISQTGTIDQVRLRRGPNAVLDGMLLAAAKTWLFQPAMKDGQPVKYRGEVIWVSRKR